MVAPIFLEVVFLRVSVSAVKKQGCVLGSKKPNANDFLTPPMSACPLPLWIQWLQALAVPVIAAVGAWIALQQMHLARVKLRHDLYDRWFAVYQADRKFSAEVLTHATVEDDQLRAYVVGTSDSVFLFNEEISTYLEQIRIRVSRLQPLAFSARNLPVGEQRTALVNEERAIIDWLTSQLPDGLVARFRPFLTLEQGRKRLPLSWLRRLGVFLHLVGRPNITNRDKAA